ncbi:prolyl oligopeptidase family serine peptidase [Nocardiopsis sp. RSe5-2]|uniref:Prolyl oligopeptidase family serine peptidase n=1 Tax=Nocardiopsis endophytica TaxID=3018445 RepID=A0ABT4U5A2_9ACTN|nr:prolyl oligopeptidase family serine peptidase [Nocardiopsis endophytica]MDA2812126.1 prolyl oligopeptidase family serine peptidase [Nocardiopsis endophytica]
MTDRVTAPHGAWPSPISASDVARGTRRLGFPATADGEVWWEEARPEEGGRTTVMRCGPDGAPAELLEAPWSAFTRVHEYGGRSFLPVPRRDDKALTRYGIVFAEASDQRLYLLERGAREPRPLTPAPAFPGALRYADPALSPDGRRIVCVRERHAGDGSVDRAIVSVPLSGRAAEDPSAVAELVTGADFYASPTPSPDGEHLAWVAWNHPRMPWDGTELRVGGLSANGVERPYTLKGGVDESVLQPVWCGPSRLRFVSDWSGWWNLYEIGLTGQAVALYPDEREFTPGPSRLGVCSCVPLADGRLVVLQGGADLVPAVYDPDTLELTPLDTGAFTTWETLGGDGGQVVGIASGPQAPQSLVRLDPATGRTQVLRSSREEMPDAALLPVPRQVEFSGKYGAAVHANVYPPTNPRGTADGPAPYAVWVHGGPVGRATSGLDLMKAYFTSRGIGVVDVNYSGSLGFGRTYRERIAGMWGVVDVEDVEAVARSLVESGEADPARLAVRGPSAGGYTALLAAAGDTFACAMSLFGVADLLQLAATTHDYESHYLDTLVGPLPGYKATYRERSPIGKADQVRVPVLLLQGTEDRVVPKEQTRDFARALADNGVRHAMLEFEGEGHGFASADSIERGLEAELAFYGEVFGFTPPGVPGIELVTEYPDPELEAEPLPELEDTGPRSAHAPDGDGEAQPAAPAAQATPATETPSAPPEVPDAPQDAEPDLIPWSEPPGGSRAPERDRPHP